MEESKMVLRTEDLVKKYGKRTVVSHVSIDVKQGEIVGLLGPNGAGKTTSFYYVSDSCGESGVEHCFRTGNDAGDAAD